MADGTVRGGFDLTTEQAVRGLVAIRDRGREADQALQSLGRRMDEIGARTARPRIELSGFDRVNAQLTELEARLDSIGRKRVAVGLGGGGGFRDPFASMTGGGGGRQGLVAGNSQSGLFSSLGGLPGRLPWWVAGAPLLPPLLGGAGGLIGSAGSAALGAGTVGLAGMASLGAGAGFTMAIARPAISGLQEITKAQDAYTLAVERYGRASTQAATATRNLNAAVAANPAAAGTARQYGAFRQGWTTATAAGRQSFYRGASGVLYNARRATPTLAAGANQSTAATANAAVAFSGFLAQPGEQAMLLQLSGSFAQNLPIAERSLENLTTTFGHLAVDALPFFREANVWVENWTTGLARSSADQVRVQSGMRTMVNSARDWARLTGDGARLLKDIFSAGQPSGDSMVVQLDHSVQRWDRWIRDNPTKVRQFFTDSERAVSRIATIVGNLARDVWSILQAVQPLLGRAEQFISFASHLGGGSLLAGGGLLYGAYEGARGALGGGGPSAGGALRAFVGGGPGGLIPFGRGGGRAGAALGGSEAAAAARAGAGSYLLAPRGMGASPGTFRIGGGYTVGGASAVEQQLPLFAAGAAGFPMRGAAAPIAARGELAFQQAYGGIEGARYAMPASELGLVPLAERGGIAGLLGRGGAAVGGAARAIAPIMAVLSAVQGVIAGASARGGIPSRINAGLSTAASTLTLGAVSPTGFQHLFSGAFGAQNAGSSLARVAPQLQSLSARANAVRSPQQLQSILGATNISDWHIRFEMDPHEAALLQHQLRQIASTAVANAGAAASSTWETSFTRGLDRGMGPQRAVSTMLGGMQSQIRALGPRGATAFARDTATWVAQMQADNPSLQRPLNRLMGSIVGDINQMNRTTGESFRDLRSKVFYFNGQILSGSATTWAKIHDALVNPMQVAQEKLSGIFGLIQQQAIDALTQMGYTRAQARQLVTSLAHGGKVAAAATQAIGVQQANVQAGGFAPGQTSGQFSQAAGTAIGFHATGGQIRGAGLLDTVQLPNGDRAAPGEAYIANRHTMNDLSRATLAKFGKTAWQMIRDETRPHSAPGRRFMLGGNATTAMRAGGFVPDPGTDFSYGQEPAIAAALNRLARSLGVTIYGISGHRSPAHSVAVGGFANDPHTRGEAADIGVNSQMRASAAQLTASELASVGLYRPFDPSGNPNNPEVNHVQLLSGGAQGALSGGLMRMGPRQLALRAPGSGLRGVPGALTTAGGRAYAAGLQQRINGILVAGSGNAIGAQGWSGGGSPTANQQLGMRMMLSAGWGMDQWPYLLALWNQESGWNANAVNSSSGASGIPQALGHGNVFRLGDAPAQIAWGLNYIRGRYGSPQAAEAHERAYNWYQTGGRVNWAGWNARGGTFTTLGPTLFGAGEKGRETVTIGHGGSGGGRQIVIHMREVTFNGGDKRQLEAMAQDVAGKILDALDRADAGVSDGELMGAA